MAIYDHNPNELIEKASQALKTKIKAPEWSQVVKTGMAKERPPENLDWWYHRAASILRKIYIKGPIGVSKLRTLYSSKKNRGLKPERVYPAGGKIIRTILQQLEEVKLIQKQEKGKKGRIITNQGKSFLDSIKKDGSRNNKEEKT